MDDCWSNDATSYCLLLQFCLRQLTVALSNWYVLCLYGELYV